MLLRLGFFVHEYSLAQSLVETVLATAAEHHAKKITEVKVIVGTFALVEPEQLEFCFHLLTEGTPAEGARLQLIEKPGVLSCTTCGYKGEGNPAEGAIYGVDIVRCPKCGSLSTILIEGDEVFVDSIQIEQ